MQYVVVIYKATLERINVIYIYICICTHTHIYTYIYTHIYQFRCSVMSDLL